MPQTVTKTYQLYTFDELSDAARQKARDCFLAGGDESTSAFEYVCEDAEQVGLRITELRDRHPGQGDFIGSAVDTARAIVKEHGPDCETFKTAALFLADIARLNLMEEQAKDDSNDYGAAREECENEFLKSLLEDYRVMLEKEIEYQQSDEVVDENIKANEYTFDETGKRCD